jgi:hypothetical protein
MHYKFEECLNDHLYDVHTDFDLNVKYGLVIERIPGVVECKIMNRYQLQIRKGKLFSWETIKPLVEERINACYSEWHPSESEQSEQRSESGVPDEHQAGDTCSYE